jgi:hypothetical protein
MTIGVGKTEQTDLGTGKNILYYLSYYNVMLYFMLMYTTGSGDCTFILTI